VAELETNTRIYFKTRERAMDCHRIVALALADTAFPGDKNTERQIERLRKQLQKASTLDIGCDLYGERAIRLTTFGSASVEPLPLIKSVCKLASEAAYIEYCFDEFHFDRTCLIGLKASTPRNFFRRVRDLDAQTAMELAVTENYLGEISHSIKSGINLNARVMGKSLLYHAFLYVDRVISQDILLKSGADPNLKNSDSRGSSPVFRALSYNAYSSHPANQKFGYTNLAKQLQLDSETHCLSRLDTLIAHGVDVNLTDNVGLTPLMKAASLGRPRLMRRLIEQGAHVNAVDNSGMSPLLHLLHNFRSSDGYITALKLLFDNEVDLSVTDTDNRNAMHLACGNPIAERLLLDAGLDYSSIKFDIETYRQEPQETLARALVRFNRPEQFDTEIDINRLLRDETLAEAVFDSIGFYGRTQIATISHTRDTAALHYLITNSLPGAARAGAAELCEFILSKLTDAHTYPEALADALNEAVTRNQQQCAELLLQAGAEKHINNIDNTDYFINALVRNFEPGVVKQCLAQVGDANSAIMTSLLRGNEEITEAVLSRSSTFPSEALLDLLDRRGRGYLDTGADNENIVRACEIAIENGARMDCRNIYGYTPLVLAAREDLVGVVDLLIGSGADVDGPDKGGRTALSHAAGKGHLGCVKLLLEAGARRNIKDARGFLPFSYAKSQKHAQIMELVEPDQTD